MIILKNKCNHLGESTQNASSSSNSLFTSNVSNINELYKIYDQERKDKEKNINHF